MNKILENWGAYFALTYLLSWSVWSLGAALLPENLFTIPLIIGAFGPFVAAIIIIRKTKGKKALSQWLRQTFNFRIGVSWYLLGAIAFPFGIAAIHHGIFMALGGQSGLEFGWEWLTYFAYLIPTALLSGGNEEPGWRGYITPVLLSKYNPIVTNVIVGIFWACWHAILYPLGIWGSDDQSFLLLIIYAIPLSMIFTWIYYTAGKSIIPAMLFHAGSNVVFRYFPMDTNISGFIDDEFTLIKTIIYSLLAIVLLIVTKGSLGYKPRIGGDS